jgi:hypothetical protein
LVADHRVDEAVALTAEVISRYANYAQLPGADIGRVRGDLQQLSSALSAAGDLQGAAEASQAASALHHQRVLENGRTACLM